jgi:hypothetical protein
VLLRVYSRSRLIVARETSISARGAFIDTAFPSHKKLIDSMKALCMVDSVCRVPNFCPCKPFERCLPLSHDARVRGINGLPMASTCHLTGGPDRHGDLCAVVVAP